MVDHAFLKVLKPIFFWSPSTNAQAITFDDAMYLL